MAVIIPAGGKPLKVATSYNRPKHHFPDQILKEFAELKYNGNFFAKQLILKSGALYQGGLGCGQRLRGGDNNH